MGEDRWLTCTRTHRENDWWRLPFKASSISWGPIFSNAEIKQKGREVYGPICKIQFLEPRGNKVHYLLYIKHKITPPYEQSVNSTTFSSQRPAYYSQFGLPLIATDVHFLTANSDNNVKNRKETGWINKNLVLPISTKVKVILPKQCKYCLIFMSTERCTSKLMV